MMYNYNFCPNCTEKFDKKTDTYYLCPKCDFRIFISPKPSASALIFNDKNQLLLTKRTLDPGKGLWDIVGGFINPGETPMEGVKREAMEEVGIEIKNLKYFGSFASDYPYKGVNYKTVSIVFLAKMPKDAEIKLSSEAKDYSFFDMDELPLDKMGVEDDRKALTELKQKRL